MKFNEAMDVVCDALRATGTTIEADDYDGVIVKRLEASNTLDDGRTTNQTHIAITGTQMDIFPYLRSDGYFNDQESDADLKKYFVTQIPVTLFETNIRYLAGDDSDAGITFSDGVKRSHTSVVRSKRRDQADQIQISLLKFDGADFVAFRRLLHTGAYLIILKRKEKFEYCVFGAVPDQGIQSDGGLSDLNNQFFKCPTNTAINVSQLQNVGERTAGRRDGGTNILLYGVPGSGKSWSVEHEYCGKDACVERVVFHPDYTYSDFVGQILPHVSEDGQVSYRFTEGPFTDILRDAYQNPEKEYILVIEEINRGNAPAIFGEVFQLLDRKTEIRDENDDGYPIGTSEYGIKNADIAAVVYGDAKHRVRIPSNLSIIGTMNTSDQNVFTLDTAFQRRWEMRLVENSFAYVDRRLAGAQILDTGVTWETFCTRINEMIVGNNMGMTSAEDKRLGVYFVRRGDLAFDSRMGNLSDGEYGQLRRKEQDKTITGGEQDRLAEICAAMRQNRKFPEKVLKYLWDDAFKFNRELVFDTARYQSLEQVIRAFLYAEGPERFVMFKEDVRAAFTNSQE